SSLASVGNITAFRLQSIITQARSEGFIASVRVATAKLSCSSALSFSCPIRWRHRVSDERSNTNACWKNSSPPRARPGNRRHDQLGKFKRHFWGELLRHQQYWKYGFSTQRSHRASSEKS